MEENITIQYEETKDHQLTLVCNGYYLHSKYAPVKEAQKFAEKHYKPHHLHVVFGYGNGFIVNALIEKCTFNEPILVIDPLIDKGIITPKKSTYERLYIASLSSLEKLENIMGKLSSYTTNILLIPSLNYNRIALEELHIVANLVKEVQYKQLTNINTSAWFAEQWQINYFMNVKNINSSRSLNYLEKKYNTPVVVAAGGPSLIKQMPLLEKYRDKMILICAGSTINSLLKYNIEPDYVVSIDGGIANYNHFKDLKLKNSRLIYSPMMHYGISKAFEKSGYLIVPHVRPSLQSHLKKQCHMDVPIISGGGSVAHFALSVAKYLTSGPIALIGQDLAYTNNQSHAEGNIGLQSDTKSDLQLEGFYGDLVNSSVKFKVMINTFNEMQVLEPHENDVLNCTEGGVKLHGYNQSTFESFLQKNCISSVTLLEDSLVEKEQNKFQSEQEILNYKKILRLLLQGQKLVANEIGPTFKKNTIRKLGEIESNLNGLYKETCLDMLLEPNILFAENKFLPPVNETAREEFIRVKEYILHLYNSCEKSVETYMKKIKEIEGEL